MKRGITFGVLVGGMTVLPLMAILYLGAQAGGLPFPPFDLFDWIARILPGDVITLGIDSIVSLIAGLNLGETSSTAKLLEQIMALVVFFVDGAVIGALFFAVMRWRKIHAAMWGGLVAGLVAAIPAVLVFVGINQTASASPGLSTVWLLAAFAAWGFAMGWIYQQLEAFSQAEAAALPVDTPEEGAAPAVGPAVTARTMNRRQFLVRVGNAAAVLTVSGTGLGALLGSGRPATTRIASPTDMPLPDVASGLPNAAAALMPAPGTRPEYTPLADHYRIDINLVPPDVDLAGWVLTVDGLVDTPITMTIDDLRNNYEPLEQFVTLSCISNRVGGDLIGTTRWTGVRLQQLLADWGLAEDAAYLKITAADGFHEVVALDVINEDERVMLAYDWDGQPLTQDHGAPLRIYIPDRYGMKQPKWITRIEVISEYEQGYWVRRGWDEVARVRTTSVIDTVAANALVEQDGDLLVPVGGIAYAGARGISRVEVKVDDGEWQEAELRDPLSGTTWVVWRYDWPFAEGRHTFAVRAYDGNGEMQDDAVRGARPSGATGTHTQSVTLAAPVTEEQPS